VTAVRKLPTPVATYVGGATAQFVDELHSLRARLPLAAGLLVAITFIVLFLMTESLVLPVKQLAMSTLSLAAAAGILVLVFQVDGLDAPPGVPGARPGESTRQPL